MKKSGKIYHSLLKNILKETSGIEEVTQVTIIQTRYNNIHIVIGCLNTFLNDVKSWNNLNNVSNIAPNKMGSVGKAISTVNPTIPRSDSDIDKGVSNTTRKNKDTIGGIITCVISNCPVGIGEPIFGKLHAELGKAMLSINAVKGFEYGSGFGGVEMNGSDHNDEFQIKKGEISTKSNYSGGIQGGISNGEDIYFNVAFKPVSTIMKNQNSIDEKNEKVIVKGKGRHDPCVVPRAVPIVEAMAANVIVDLYLQSKTIK